MECGLAGEAARVRAPLPGRLLAPVAPAMMWPANHTAPRRTAAEPTRHVSAAGT
ncbi:hypothetical protein FB570_110202 [Streptomyces sp. T12]|uniref:hypothetical protein n=1 Tax=Streptomyces sp. T12 TaxID=477697 RepID=UPI0011ACDD8B|nr:hypothetical protein [Streptomyces sp. T12]TWD18087.1 hypothetical protein FB570_110202 [Streptomyces sp. T12]